MLFFWRSPNPEVIPELYFQKWPGEHITTEMSALMILTASKSSVPHIKNHRGADIWKASVWMCACVCLRRSVLARFCVCVWNPINVTKVTLAQDNPGRLVWGARVFSSLYFVISCHKDFFGVTMRPFMLWAPPGLIGDSLHSAWNVKKETGRLTILPETTIVCTPTPFFKVWGILSFLL